MEVALRDLSKLAPLAVVLAIAGIAMAWMLQRQMGVGTWLFAAFLFGHGLVHVMFAWAPPASADPAAAEYPFDATRSWVVTNGILSAGALKALVIPLVVAVVVGYTLTALATVSLIVPETWWTSLLILSTLGSLALMVIGFGPALALGIAIDIVLLWVAIAAVWSPTATVAT